MSSCILANLLGLSARSHTLVLTPNPSISSLPKSKLLHNSSFLTHRVAVRFAYIRNPNLLARRCSYWTISEPCLQTHCHCVQASGQLNYT
ncbi:hypothetical protein EI94DRAFT_1736901 [Lactarius quietus]|nr:hypothetical protein EI94DRAFT_1736901 [Lactarius quietus]